MYEIWKMNTISQILVRELLLIRALPDSSLFLYTVCLVKCKIFTRHYKFCHHILNVKIVLLHSILWPWICPGEVPKRTFYRMKCASVLFVSCCREWYNVLEVRNNCLSGNGDSSMSGVTENTTYSMTTWKYPWPPQIHWLDPYINLSSYSQEIINGIVLGDKLKKEIRNWTSSFYGWVIDFRADGDLTDAHYNKYYMNSTQNMFICHPTFAQFMKKSERPRTNLELARCVNYTAGMWDWQKRKAQWKYMWKHLKHPMTSMFALAGVVTITGVFGESIFDHEISVGYPYTMEDPGFPRRGRQLLNLEQKLYENERNWTGSALSCCPLGSTNAT